MKEKIKDGFRLYALTFTIPIVLTIMDVLFCLIAGADCKFGFFGNLKAIWIDFFFIGRLLGIIAWKIHLVILFICLFMSFND